MKTVTFSVINILPDAKTLLVILIVIMDGFSAEFSFMCVVFCVLYFNSLFLSETVRYAI